MQTRVRQFAQRALLVVLGLLLSLVAIEVILQVGAVYVRATGRAYPDAWLTSRRRVMCIGDSNVYGVWVRRDQTFPAYLEKIWNSAAPSEGVEVLNFGIPGMNSSRVRATYHDLMARFRPDLVIVLVGVNDAWTAPVPIDDAAGADDRFRYTLWQRSRLFRLLSMIATRLNPGSIAVDLKFKDGWQVRGHVLTGDEEFNLSATAPAKSVPDWPKKLHENLHALASATDEIGAELVVMSYPTNQSIYGAANTVIIREKGDLKVIVPDPFFKEVCPGSECFFPDWHLKVPGYQLLAAIVWNNLRYYRLAPAIQDNSAAFSGLNETVKKRLERLGYL